jgi:hypothetical protein
VRLGLVVLCVCVCASARAADMRIAVLEFSSAAGDPALDSLGNGLQSMVTTDGDGDGFVGFIFNGPGYASIGQATVNVEGASR